MLLQLKKNNIDICQTLRMLFLNYIISEKVFMPMNSVDTGRYKTIEFQQHPDNALDSQNPSPIRNLISPPQTLENMLM